jgi:molecular chaperone GrpE
MAQARHRQGKQQESAHPRHEGSANEDTDTDTPAGTEALAENEELALRIEALEEEVASLKREEKYHLAEFDTFRRRTRQEQEEFRKSAARDLLAELLDIEDGFRSAEAGWSESDPDAWREGIEIIARKFAALLERHGVKPIEAEGSVFDPAIHEALFVVDEGDHEGEIVGQVIQRGYFLNDKVLRLAKVKVSRGLARGHDACGEQGEGE